MPNVGERYAYNNSRTGQPEYFTILAVDAMAAMVSYQYSDTGRIRTATLSKFLGIFSMVPTSQPGTTPVRELVLGRSYRLLKSDPFIGIRKGDVLTYTGDGAMGSHGFSSADRQTYYIEPDRLWEWMEPVESSGPVEQARHVCEYVNVSFNSIRMACRSCGQDKPRLTGRINTYGLQPEEKLRCRNTGHLVTVKYLATHYVEVRFPDGAREHIYYDRIDERLEYPEDTGV